MINLGTLKEITDLRSVWPHEALNFTPWVAENVDLLADAVGLDITVDETESSVGDFNVDIYASETGTDRKIIIENQLEDTDHDHLGKLITYASGKGADVVIWVVKHAREEHKAAIEWLNNHTDDKIGFFLCEIKLFQIGNSDIAPSFTVVERPNDWTKEIKKTTAANSTQQQRLEYWQAFNDYAFQNTEFAKVFNKRKPTTDHWMDFSIGSSACHIGVTQIQKRSAIGVELYINDDKELFKSLFVHKAEIESDMGMELDWRELPERKASRILVEKNVQLSNREEWQIGYLKAGDYFISAIELKPIEVKRLGKYGRMRRAFLQEYNPMLFNDLVLTEQLFPHLYEVQEIAEERVEVIMEGLLEKNSAPAKETAKNEKTTK